MMDIIVQGWDISLNHGAVVELKNGELNDWWYYTDQAGSAGRSKEHGSRLELPKDVDWQARNVARIVWIEKWMDKVVLVPRRPQFVGVEDYALDAKHGAHYKGEVGGFARYLLWMRGVRFRLHDPISVKMFATWDGTAQKDSVEAAVAERWGWTFDQFNIPPDPKRKGKPSRQTSEDLCDAFSIAKLVWAEVQLRAGRLRLDELDHDKERQVFNRVTKSYPVSLLSREWIHNPNGKFTPHGRHPRCSSERCGLTVLKQNGCPSLAAAEADLAEIEAADAALVEGV